MTLYSETQKREGEKLRFLAALQGVQVDRPVESKEAGSPMLFKDPREYENLSEEERQKLTDQMMGLHKRAMASTPLGRTM